MHSRLRLHQRYFLILLCLVTASVGLVSAALLLQFERSTAKVEEVTARAHADALTRQFEQRASGLALVTAEALVNPLALLNMNDVQVVVEAVEAEPDVISVIVYDRTGLALFVQDGELLPRSTVSDYEEERRLVDRLVVREQSGRLMVSAPVRLGERLLGVVRLDLSTAELTSDIESLLGKLADIDAEAARSRMLWMIGTAAMILVLATLSTVLVARGLSRPIEFLSSLTARIGRGEYDVEIPIRRGDEIGDLAQALAAMARNLERTTVSRDKFDRILSSMRDGLLVTTPEGRITDANEAAARVVGKTVAQLIGRPVAEVIPGGEAIVTLQHHELLKTGFLDSFETAVTGPDGSPIPVLLSVAAMRGPNDQLHGIVCIFHDIAERKRIEAQVQHMAHHDPLTGLPNRTLLVERMRQATAQARRRRDAAALLLLDLDRFKTVNDTLGHDAGDAVLTIVGRRIRALLRETDTVARLGGDEFALVQTRVRQSADVESLCQRLIDALTRPIHLARQDIRLGASIGVALYPRDGNSFEQLLKRADLALYHAKAAGRSSWRIYEVFMDVRRRERRALERDLGRALANGELALHYQPQVELAGRRITGVEALLRWRHDSLGWVPPSTFLPLAEQTGSIVAIGSWVLSTACRQIADCSRQNGHELRLSVNASAAELRHPELEGSLACALRTSTLPAQRLELEVTEEAILQDPEAVLATLRRLKRQGVRITLDGFGAGNTGLGLLRQMPFDTIKIDRSFVADLGRSTDALAVLRATHVVARSLGAECVAAGVETAAQLAVLEREGCTRVQGHLFSPAVPIGEVGRRLGQPCAA